MSDQLPYLIRLGERLSAGLLEMDETRKQRHREFILAHQMPDGGFRGREGDSDLYYTSFAVRSLMMLDGIPDQAAQSLIDYMRSLDWRSLNVIDMMNWFATALAIQLSTGTDLIADEPNGWQQDVSTALEAVRTADGGYAKSTEGASGSTYHSFLVMLTYQLTGGSVPQPNRLVQFLYDRQRDDGGFVEIGPMRRSGTNPTAAAAAILKELNAVDAEICEDVAAFLNDVRGDEGGFQANTRVPFCDSLSTFTGMLTTQDLSLSRAYKPDPIHDWVTTQLEFPTGGFRAASWDENADVEYTFYGLGVLALLASET